jgi:hypothetical protein
LRAATFCGEESFGDFGRLKKCVKEKRRGKMHPVAAMLTWLETHGQWLVYHKHYQPPGVSDVWQAKDLCVAGKGLAGNFLADKW